MIHEYALEPAVINSWDRLQRVMAQFGFRTGRLIGRIPGKYRKAILDCLPDSCTDAERSKIAARLRDFEDAVMVAREHTWQPDADWIDCIKREDSVRPFRMILSHTQVSDGEKIVRYSDLDESEPPHGWEPDDGDIPRLPQFMADRLRLVLQTAKRFIRIVDKNLHPATPRFRDVFAAFFEHIRTSPARVASTKIELHVSDRFHCESYDREAQQHLSPELPSGSDLQIVRWPEHRMHNRYVLTEKVGVLLGTGADSNTKRDAGIETDTFTLLPTKSWLDQLNKYTIDDSIWGTPDVITIESTRS